jgi:hypothetical protein
MSKKTLDTSKIVQQLEDADGDGTPVVLFLSGALSPVHKMHVQCFEVSSYKVCSLYLTWLSLLRLIPSAPSLRS